MVELIKIAGKDTIEQLDQFQHGANMFGVKDGILLKTCNRVECYSGKGKVPDEVTRHLFRVVSGLESAIIGETAITGQVKQAYQEAMQNNELDKSLHKLFQTALYVGKKVRHETGISRGAMSHSQAAVNLLFDTIKNVKNLNITVIGANALNEKIIKFLVSKGAETIFIGNRTYEKAQKLAIKYNARALRFDSLVETLKKTDVLISATSAPHFILKKENFHINRQMYILDLAVPADVDPLIGDLPNVSLFDIMTIEKHIQKNIRVRTEKVLQAEKIIKKEVQLFSKINGSEEGIL